MNVVICQAATAGKPTADELIEVWKEELKDCDKIDSVRFEKRRFDMEHADEILADADAVVGIWLRDNWFDDAFFERFPKLKYMASFAHGFCEMDHDMLRRHGVTVANTIYGDVTISQFAMGLLLEICYSIRIQDNYYRKCLEGHAAIGADRNSEKIIGRQYELYGKTMGIIGLGNIGLWTARMAAGFGMHIVAYSRHKKEGPEYDFVEQVSLDELLARSDVISIHCPATHETNDMINRETIAKMKDGVIIINTARGSIIDEDALKEGLDSGKIYAAGLDVVKGEPLTEKTPIFDCENAVITGHIAWLTEESRYRAVRVAATNLKNWLNGTPTSTIF